MLELQSTFDNEIETLTQAIASKRNHTNRVNYVAEVQPMKDELSSLIDQNEIIKSNNAAAIAAEPPTPEQVAAKLNQDIEAETRLTYPYISDERGIIRRILAAEFPDNADAQAYNTNIEAAISKVNAG